MCRILIYIAKGVDNRCVFIGVLALVVAAMSASVLSFVGTSNSVIVSHHLDDHEHEVVGTADFGFAG